MGAQNRNIYCIILQNTRLIICSNASWVAFYQEEFPESFIKLFFTLTKSHAPELAVLIDLTAGVGSLDVDVGARVGA